MCVDADPIQACGLDLLKNVEPQRRNREAESVELSGAVKVIGLRRSIYVHDIMDILKENSLTLDDETKAVPLNNICQAIRRE